MLSSKKEILGETGNVLYVVLLPLWYHFSARNSVVNFLENQSFYIVPESVKFVCRIILKNRYLRRIPAF